MRLTCPYCGDRDSREFVYRGDAAPSRPEGAADASGTLDAFHDYVFLRDNKAGAMTELWQHVAGCRSWLVVTRNTLTHEVTDVAFVGGTKR
jgi:sarcosine oxidase subunit delta